jgi:hypothetical protein
MGRGWPDGIRPYDAPVRPPPIGSCSRPAVHLISRFSFLSENSRHFIINSKYLEGYTKHLAYAKARSDDHYLDWLSYGLIHELQR